MNSACFLILLPAQGVTPTRFCFALRDVDYHLAYRHSFLLASGNFASGFFWECVGFAVDHVHHSDSVVFKILRVH